MTFKVCQMLSQPGWKGLRKVRKALERLDLPSKLAKRCQNQANEGLRKVEMTFKVYQTLSQPERPRKDP